MHVHCDGAGFTIFLGGMAIINDSMANSETSCQLGASLTLTEARVRMVAAPVTAAPHAGMNRSAVFALRSTSELARH